MLPATATNYFNKILPIFLFEELFIIKWKGTQYKDINIFLLDSHAEEYLLYIKKKRQITIATHDAK